jgi:hypothetical protein
MLNRRSATIVPRAQFLHNLAAARASEERKAGESTRLDVAARDRLDYEMYLDWCSEQGIEPEYKTFERYREAV